MMRVIMQRANDRVREKNGLGQAALPAKSPRWIEEFWISHRSDIVRVATAQIDLIEADRDYMRLHVGAHAYLLHKTISELERQLDPGRFIRLHRSTIVARDRIVGFSRSNEGIWNAQLQRADGLALKPAQPDQAASAAKRQFVTGRYPRGPRRLRRPWCACA